MDEVSVQPQIPQQNHIDNKQLPRPTEQPQNKGKGVSWKMFILVVIIAIFIYFVLLNPLVMGIVLSRGLKAEYRANTIEQLKSDVPGRAVSGKPKKEYWQELLLIEKIKGAKNIQYVYSLGAPFSSASSPSLEAQFEFDEETSEEELTEKFNEAIKESGYTPQFEDSRAFCTNSKHILIIGSDIISDSGVTVYPTKKVALGLGDGSSWTKHCGN